MADTTLSVVLKLRRDNDYNYEKVKDIFIPENGEPILVDTARDGLRVKVGDGSKTYSQLDYIDDIFIKGYLNDDIFYEDIDHTEIIQGKVNKIYINLIDNSMYYYDGTNYVTISGSPTASANVAGIMKLYDITGDNSDGTMTQRAITKELNEKFEMDVVPEDEMLIFDHDIN